MTREELLEIAGELENRLGKLDTYTEDDDQIKQQEAGIITFICEILKGKNLTKSGLDFVAQALENTRVYLEENEDGEEGDE